MRIAMGISYNGQPYQGWQSQLSGLTIQDKLEQSLSKFAAHRVSTLCAGRTDAGVHGLMQVVHFDTPLSRSTHAWLKGGNAGLPPDIAIQWAKEMPETFHCRANAISRRYIYVLLESEVRPSIDHGRVGWVYRPLDLASMKVSSSLLLGEHDFTSFRASACQSLSPIKQIYRMNIDRRDRKSVV